jgi:hypothetical protein
LHAFVFSSAANRCVNFLVLPVNHPGFPDKPAGIYCSAAKSHVMFA